MYGYYRKNSPTVSIPLSEVEEFIFPAVKCREIAIARAVLKNAPIIILDEATAFADPDNEVKVQKAFAKLSEGKTVIMIAHRLSTVRNVDCIYVISDGKIVEYGNRAELIEKKGMFYKMQNDYQSSVGWKVSNETEESRND